jgi:hypothetical protein
MSTPLTGLDADPYINVVHRGIKHGIDLVVEDECWRAAIILLYAGIDAMAFTTLPPERQYVKPQDFIAWVERYIRFPGPFQVSGADLYGARCAALHTYGSESRMSRDGECRIILHVKGGSFPVVADPTGQANAVAVELHALRDAFYRGIDRYVAEAQRDPAQWARVEARLRDMMHEIPFEPPAPDAT